MANQTAGRGQKIEDAYSASHTSCVAVDMVRIQNKKEPRFPSLMDGFPVVRYSPLFSAE